MSSSDTIDPRNNQLNRLYLVTGGCGFLGSHIVQSLLFRGHSVRILDTVHLSAEQTPPTLHSYLCGDITVYQDVADACEGVDCVFHCAALTGHLHPPQMYRAVNIQGTANVILACIEKNVNKLIYTSSSSVILDGNDCQDGDESIGYPQRHLDRYSFTKCHGEKRVLKANGVRTRNGNRLMTCALRPHSIFGERDRHFIAQILEKGMNGEITHVCPLSLYSFCFNRFHFFVDDRRRP